ncbi:MAG: calcium-binding protein [Candidatus Cloacimonetes bacterium]|nr:calcium-binding protein [Candidatus Cloacimonadota bacterium]MCF7814961.1 calcium-binding protein [Candidatus Cloacimonadota bacterium]MCF7869227.1 calcium-binding protein [Candidatus Cloacimonadota bacterium]MCF7884644.1 calcium-binding protein [Candidatus Cloacimonadota bacterium]
MHAIEPIFADYVGLIVRVTRVSDKKRFKLPLADLKVIDRKSPNYQIVDDYSVWFGNY